MKTSVVFGLLALVSTSGMLAAGAQRGVPAANSSSSALAPVAVANFGLAPDHGAITCDGKTIGFWASPNGEALITAGGFLSVLPSLNVVDENGLPFQTHDFATFKDWMHHANAMNMAYMLSAQLVAMKFNILSGMVNERCVTDSPELGVKPVRGLVDQCILALRNDPYTPAGDPNRDRQEVLKDVLDAANNNLIWP